MFNLLVKSQPWSARRDQIAQGRVFEYTDDALAAELRTPADTPDLVKLMSYPAMFMQETTGGGAAQFARVGNITNARNNSGLIAIDYSYEGSIPPLSNELIESLAGLLDIQNGEFSRTHWSVKDVDLFAVLVRNMPMRRPPPKVFNLADPEHIQANQVSVMMPFAAGFNSVYAPLQAAAESESLVCKRADDIWIDPRVMQDVVSLIDRSAVVICDCTGRNPNVFYEIGIAHTLGREVILITQNHDDIPFDLRHLRYVHYLQNGEGLAALGATIQERLQSLTSP